LENITDNVITNRAETISNLNLPGRSGDFAVASEAVDKLITEGGESFYDYVAELGLVKDSNLIVLSSLHNYFYDADEMNDAKTVINLKELNQIKQLKSLLYSHLHLLPPKCNFVGCFVNNEKVERYALRNHTHPGEKILNNDDLELGIVSRFPLVNMLYSMMDLKTNMFMSERSVTLLLRVNGFKVLDMTDLNGLTFFHAQKVDETFN
jgi:hypothetical protein